MGPFGEQLADSVFVRSPLAEARVPKAHQKQKDKKAAAPSPVPMLMEFFPPGTFVRDQQYAMQQLKIDYLGWWAERCVVRLVRVDDTDEKLLNRTFTDDNLPEVTSGVDVSQDPVVPVDVDAILRKIREEAPRRAT